jgi:hypothetical protein
MVFRKLIDIYLPGMPAVSPPQARLATLPIASQGNTEMTIQPLSITLIGRSNKSV